jgi:urea carboxylase
VHYDPHQLPLQQLLDHLIDAEHALHAQLDELAVPSRIVHIPLSWDDDACKEAIVKYDQSVRANAPWAPSNLEFIRRINGIASIDAVKSIVFNASYLVMGLGDVYLGAPVATPMDPRHRLVTTKYNPARTWTAENSVGIGGAYLCVYGMEGPGGYQFIGRTLQMWNRYRTTPEFSQPWLLRFFDQIRFYEVSQEELLTIRRQFPLGQYPLKIDQTTFSLTDYEEHLARNHSSIEAFTRQRQLAFQEELARWHADGQFNFATSKEDETQQAITLLACEHAVESTVSGSVWQLLVEAGEQVTQGQTLLVMESMKMEIAITANHAGTVSKLLVNQGSQVRAGQTLALITDTS